MMDMPTTLNSAITIEVVMSIRREDIDADRMDYAGVIDSGRPRMKPTHPGEILKEEFLKPLGISAYRLSKDIQVPLNRVSLIIEGKRGISADTALRFARYFGTDAQSWVNLQARYDLESVQRVSGKRIGREVKPRAA
jgi:addiction module HigA family antidote